MPKPKEELLDKYDKKIMDWFYECVNINFGVDMIQDSSDLRTILRELLQETHKSAIEECISEVRKPNGEDKWVKTHQHLENWEDWIEGYNYCRNSISKSLTVTVADQDKRLCVTCSFAIITWS